MADTTQPSESARDALLTLLEERGYRSVFDIVRQPRHQFIASVGERTDGAWIYAAAERRAAAVVGVRNALVAREEPASRSLARLNANNDPKRLGQLGLSEGFDYEHWFKQAGHFVADTSVASLFSPASYLVDLYRHAVALHSTDNDLHLDKRRPDIAALPLSQANLDQEIATIEVVNDVLLARIGSLEKLSEAPYPFGLPYDHDAASLDRAMQALSTSGWDIVRDLGAPEDPWRLDFTDDASAAEAFASRFPAEWTRSVLGICPVTYAMLTSDQPNDWESWWNGDASALTPEKLQECTGLTMSAIHDMLGTDPIWFWQPDAEGKPKPTPSKPRYHIARYINSPEADSREAVAVRIGDAGSQGELANTTSARLDRLQRVVRLQDHTGLDFDVLDYLVTSERASTPAMTALPRIAQMLALQPQIPIDAWDYAFLTGVMHAYAQDSEPSRVERMFGRELTALLGLVNAPTIDFDSAIADVDEASRRVRAALCRGLAIDDSLLVRLVERYSAATGIDTNAVPLKFALPSALYRVCRTASLTGCAVDDLLRLWNEMDRGSGWIADVVFGRAADPDLKVLSMGAPIVLEATLHIARWLGGRRLALPLLLAMVTRTEASSPTPEIEALVQSIRSSTFARALEDSLSAGEQEAAGVQLSRHVAAALGTQATVVAAMMRWMDRVMAAMEPGLAGYSLLTFWTDAHRESADAGVAITPTMVLYCHMLARFTIACQFAGLTERDIDLIVAPQGRSPLTGSEPPKLDLEGVRWLGEYAAWRDSLPGSSAEAVQWLSTDPAFSADTAAAIARIHEWDVGATQESIASLGNADGDTVYFPQLHRVWQWMRASNRYLLSPRQLRDLIALSQASDPMATETKLLRKRAASFVSGAAHARTSGGRHSGLEGDVAEDLRDACVAYEISRLSGRFEERIRTADDLCEFLLLDTQVTSIVMTSRIAEAIASVQLYINRCREGMEPDVDATALADLEKAGGYFALWNTYNKRYGTWSGLHRLLRYPATYIEPALRYGKTSAFTTLEQRLSKGRLSIDAADEAFSAFVQEACTMLSLTWWDGFQLSGTDAPIWFLGSDTTPNPRYYWRRTLSRTDHRLDHWTEWKPVNAAIRPSVRRPSIVHFAGKLRIAWIEWREMRLGTELPGSLWKSRETEASSRIVEAHAPVPLGRPSSFRAEADNSDTVMAAFFLLATCDGDDTWSVKEYPLEASPLSVDLASLHSLEHFYVSTYTDSDGEHIIAVISDSKEDYERVLDIDAQLRAHDGSQVPIAISPPGYSSRLVRRPLVVGADEDHVVLVGVPREIDVTITRGVTPPYQIRIVTTAAVTEFSIEFSHKVGDAPPEMRYVTFQDLVPGVPQEKGTPFQGMVICRGWRCEVAGTSYEGGVNETATHFEEDPDGLATLENAVEGGWSYLRLTDGTELQSLSTFAAPFFLQKLAYGIDELLDYTNQIAQLEPSFAISRKITFAGAVGIYMYELFFHAPFLIASRLIDDKRFDEAEIWLGRLFSPSGHHNAEGAQEEDINGAALYWNVRALQEDVNWNDRPVGGTDDPDIVAAADPMHYKLAVFLHWLKLYVDRGDDAYRQQTRDALGEAKMWYVRATLMLGPRPEFHEHPANLWSDATVQKAKGWTDADLDALDAGLEADREAHDTHTQSLLIEGEFRPPVDAALLRWWDIVERRLYNLRHGLSLNGLPMLTPLYETPVDPRDLQNRRIAGDTSRDLSGPPFGTTPPHRFAVMLDRTRAAVQNLVQFGAGLAGALERKDANALSLLQQQNQVALYDLARSVHERNIESLEHAIESTVINKNAAMERSRHFAREAAEFISPLELAATTTRVAAGALVAASAPAFIVAGSLDMAPNIFIGGLAVGTGGSKWGGIAGGIANSLALIGQSLESHAGNIEVSAQYLRRADDWRREAAEADATRAAMGKQELSQRSSLEAARRQLAQMDAEQAFAEGLLDVLGSRFTSQAFYNWQAARMSTLYYQLYDACLGLCAQTQAAYAFETSDNTIYIKPGAWDDQYQGLLAGEHLTLSLQRLEQAWMERDVRVMEIERTLALSSLAGDIPLSELIADALGTSPRPSAGLDVSYQENILRLGFVLSDAKLMEDYPDNMGVGEIRRIKSIAVTLPALLGPFEDIRAVLSYTNGVAASLAEGCTAVAISRGLADSGQFILDFHDGRYLPFEGIPIDDGGTFGLSFPNTEGHSQEEMLRSITDVILHIRYTARPSAN